MNGSYRFQSLRPVFPGYIVFYDSPHHLNRVQGGTVVRRKAEQSVSVKLSQSVHYAVAVSFLQQHYN